MKIILNNISKTYNIGTENAYKALDNVSISIAKGEMIAITGKSGSGKSTLLHILGLVDSFDEGVYIFNGQIINQKKEGQLAKLRNQKIGYILQDFALINKMNVFDNIAIPLYLGNKIGSKTEKQVLYLANRLGIEKLLYKKVNYLSGGEKQRVAIARALIMQPEIILADEPTGALDTKTTFEIIKIFKEINENGTTVVIVTHDKDVANFCTNKIEIKNGRIIM